MQALLVMQETPSVLRLYPCSDNTTGLWAWPCRAFKSQCARKAGL